MMTTNVRIHSRPVEGTEMGLASPSSFDVGPSSGHPPANWKHPSTYSSFQDAEFVVSPKNWKAWLGQQIVGINLANVALLITIIAISANINSQLDQQRAQNLQSSQQIQDLQQQLNAAAPIAAELQASGNQLALFNATLNYGISLGFLNLTGQIGALSSQVVDTNSRLSQTTAVGNNALQAISTLNSSVFNSVVPQLAVRISALEMIGQAYAMASITSGGFTAISSPQIWNNQYDSGTGALSATSTSININVPGSFLIGISISGNSAASGFNVFGSISSSATSGAFRALQLSGSQTTATGLVTVASTTTFPVALTLNWAAAPSGYQIQAGTSMWMVRLSS
jgi:hypothetical protein